MTGDQRDLGIQTGLRQPMLDTGHRALDDLAIDQLDALVLGPGRRQRIDGLPLLRFHPAPVIT
ncbi:hypothetical protein CKO40_17345 [Halochromatium glycolicum]|uniref:Uncharacterized protein n=1 Tax=Halochromatium glycolicum TaxID=85075 RepID=A0AAJ0XBM3_9GAMM|nr:hypothetical protein [Halochromatium glycolicum]